MVHFVIIVTCFLSFIQVKMALVNLSHVFKLKSIVILFCHINKLSLITPSHNLSAPTLHNKQCQCLHSSMKKFQKLQHIQFILSVSSIRLANSSTKPIHGHKDFIIHDLFYGYLGILACTEKFKKEPPTTV